MSNVIPHNRLTYGEAECAAVSSAVHSGQWAQGPRVQELEARLADIAQVSHAVCVGSGLAALRLALGALGIASGDRVLVPAYSCVALANAVLSWGAEPIPMDVENQTWNLQMALCREAIHAHRPRAVIAVNTFGVPARFDQILASGIPVIEDCAHGFGIDINGRMLGGRAHIGVLSFYATKLIGGGEGGAVLTNSPDVAEFVRAARDYGDQPACGHRMNDKMSDIEAALVSVQLQRLPQIIAQRDTLARRYLDKLATSDGKAYRLPIHDERRIWYRFAIEMLSNPGETALKELATMGIEAALPVTDWRSAGVYNCPIADRAYRNLISLPLFPTLTIPEQDRVVEGFLQLCREKVCA